MPHRLFCSRGAGDVAYVYEYQLYLLGRRDAPLEIEEVKQGEKACVRQHRYGYGDDVAPRMASELSHGYRVVIREEASSVILVASTTRSLAELAALMVRTTSRYGTLSSACMAT